jgi:hypothetical protein
MLHRVIIGSPEGATRTDLDFLCPIVTSAIDVGSTALWRIAGGRWVLFWRVPISTSLIVALANLPIV